MKTLLLTILRSVIMLVLALTGMGARDFVYRQGAIYHIQDQFNGEMLKQYQSLSPQLDGWYNQNTHQIHLTPVSRGGKTYYRIASAFGKYFSAPDRPGKPLNLNASDTEKQLWEFVPHTTADGRDYGFYYIRNKATGGYLFDSIDPDTALNLRQPDRGFDADKNQSFPTTAAVAQPPKNDRRYLWRIDPTETEIPDIALSVPQSGWTPKANKIAVLGVANALSTPPNYTITDANGNLLYTGKAIEWGRYWSGHTYYILNLNIPALEHEGDYKVTCNDKEAEVLIRNDALLHPFRQGGSDRFDLKEIFDPHFGFVTQWGRLTSWWPRAYDWLVSLHNWDWKQNTDSSHNVNTFPHWMWRDIRDDNRNGNTYENLSETANRDEADGCLDGGWDDTDTFAHNYAIDGQMLDELARLYRHTDDAMLHDRIYDEILYGVRPMLERQESDGQWRMGYMDQQHWSGTTAALGMGLAAVLPIVEKRDTALADRIKEALAKTWTYMQNAKDDKQSWAVPKEGILHDGTQLAGYVGNQRTMWREAYLMLAVNLYEATRDPQYKAAVEAEILSGHFAYNGWMNKDPNHPFAGQYHVNAIFALEAMLRYYDDASPDAKAHIKDLATYFYETQVVSDTLLGGPFGNYSKRRTKPNGDGVDAWLIWEYMAASTQLYEHFGDAFGQGMLLAQRALDWYWGANPYAASLMQGVGTRFMNYGWSSPHTIGRHMGLSVTTENGFPKARGTDGNYPMSEATVPSSLAIWNAIVLMQKYADHNWTKIYADPSYHGTCTRLATGKYTHKMLQAYGLDTLGSIRVPAGYTIKLYTEDNFGGTVTEYAEDTNQTTGTWRSIEITYLPNAGKVVSVPEGTEITARGEASQSTTLYNNSTYSAAKAIDGDTDTFTHTDLTTHGNYWQLLLDARYSIGRIVIVNRTNYGSRLNGCVVKVLDERQKVLWSRSISHADDGATLTFALPPETIGRYIRIGLEGNAQNGYGDYVVTIAEIHVYAGETPEDNTAAGNDDGDMTGDGGQIHVTTGGTDTVDSARGGSGDNNGDSNTEWNPFGFGGGCSYNPRSNDFDLMIFLMLIASIVYPLRRRSLG